MEIPFDTGFDARYGLDVDLGRAAAEGIVTARVPVTGALLGEHGAVHGGLFASLAEAIASTGTWVAVQPDGLAAMGLSNDTTVVGELREGEIHAEARAESRAGDAWVWSVRASARGELVAFSRVTVAVRPARG